MLKKTQKKVETTEDVIESIICDRCQKNMGNNLNDYLGAHFIPSSSWSSWLSDTDYEFTRVDLCDECWTIFYDEFIFDHLKHTKKES